MGLRVTIFAILYAVSMFAMVVTFRVGGLTVAPNHSASLVVPKGHERVEASVLFRVPEVESKRAEVSKDLQKPAPRR